MRFAGLAAALLVCFSAAAQVDGALANIPEDSPTSATATPPPIVEDVAPPLPSSDDVVDMTPFQKAYDKEVAEEQAQATGAVAPPAARGDASTDGDGMGNLAVRATGALAAICGAIILLGWLAKRFGAKSPLLAGAQLAQVLGRTYLEPKAALHFVKTGGRVLVVGVTPTGMHLITEFEAEQFEQSPAAEAVAPKTSGVEAGFLAKLREQQEQATVAASGNNEELDTLRSDIQRLKQYLQENRRGTGL